MLNNKLLEVIKLNKRFGGLQAVDDLDFYVEEGEILGLIGPNGAGKTTTFNLIAGRYSPDSGEVRFDGANIIGLRSDQVCTKGICRTFQVPQTFGELTVLENVAIGGFCHTTSPQEAMDIAAEHLEFVDLYHRRGHLARDLNTIDQRRLEIARALATHPRLLLMDETMAGLTPTEIDVAIGLIRKVRDNGITVVVVEHVMRAIMNLSERIVVLDAGAKIAEGTPQEIASNEAVIRAYLGEEQRHASV